MLSDHHSDVADISTIAAPATLVVAVNVAVNVVVVIGIDVVFNIFLLFFHEVGVVIVVAVVWHIIAIDVTGSTAA